MFSSEMPLMVPGPRPALRPARRGTVAQALLAAAGVHAALLALLLLAVHPAPLPKAAEPPAFTMVFAPETPLEAAAEAPSPAPQPPVPPPELAAAPPPAPEPPPTSETPPTAEAPPPEAPVPPVATQPPPPSEVPTASPVPAPEPPRPLAPVQPPPRPPVLRRPLLRPLPRPSPPRAVASSRAPESPPTPYAPPGALATPPRAAAETPVPATRPPSAAPISGGWRNALVAWLQAHKTYPEAARMEGAEGRVVLRFTASRDGRVLQVEVVQPSGSRVLDEAAEALLRGARLPPFPASMAQDTATVTLPLTYQLE